MNLGEVMIRVVFTFLAVFFAVISGGYFLSLIIDFTYPQWAERSIIAAFAMASLCCWTWFFAYSKTALCSRQMLSRYFAAYVANLVIMFAVLEFLHAYFGWGRGIVLVYHLTAFLGATITFLCIVALSAWQARLACDNLNQSFAKWQQCRTEEVVQQKSLSNEVMED